MYLLTAWAGHIFIDRIRRIGDNEITAEQLFIEDQGGIFMQPPLPDETLIASMTETFKVLGAPTRVKILFILSLGETSEGTISRALKMSPSAISHQLRILRSLKLVRRRQQGKMALYSLDDQHVFNLLKEFLEHMRHGTIGA